MRMQLQPCQADLACVPVRRPAQLALATAFAVGLEVEFKHTSQPERSLAAFFRCQRQSPASWQGRGRWSWPLGGSGLRALHTPALDGAAPVASATGGGMPVVLCTVRVRVRRPNAQHPSQRDARVRKLSEMTSQWRRRLLSTGRRGEQRSST